MKAWAVLLPFLCINTRRLDKRSLTDAVAPPDGYLPSQDYEYEEDLAGYSATQDDLAGYSSAENELLHESEDLPASRDSEDETTTNEPQAGDFKGESQTNKPKEDEMENSKTEDQKLENSLQDNEKEDEEEDLIRYNAGVDDLIENELQHRIEFDRPLFTSDSDDMDNEATTKQPNDDMDGSSTSVKSLLQTGYGSPGDENSTLNVEEGDSHKDNVNTDQSSPEDDAVVTDDKDNKYGAPPLETNHLTDAAKDITRDGQDDISSDILEKSINDEDDKTNEQIEMHQIANEDNTTESPNNISETQEDTEEDANQPNISVINSSYFPSLSSSIKICPGGSMTVCVSVCPGTSATIYGACVQGCAERCEGQDPR
eukprot:GFUD01083151.1.p1 GENE.GFUD01083151.1~~GFUD01083151.1.p1  ORF type:complete len:379 (+),score=132.36 GFUD01083151.1:27-1139(+)